MALKTRKPTGKPPWPLALIAGMEKAGKSFAAAEASASPLIDRTFWFSHGEQDPDEYGAIDGARFEIVEYDGTFRDLYLKMKEAAEEPMDPAKPHLWVLDSGTKLWDLLSDMAQVEKNRRWAKRQQGAKADEVIPGDGLRVDMDLWNVARTRWDAILELMNQHQGPSIITARLEKKAVVDEKTGEPTKAKEWKVLAQKMLPFEVGVVVELHSRGEAYLTGVRSLRFRPTEARTPYPDFTMHGLWVKLGLAEGAGVRNHTQVTGEQSVAADDIIVARRKELLATMIEVARNARVTTDQLRSKWLESHDHEITVTTNIGDLERLLEYVRYVAEQRTQAAAQQLGATA